jgi:hypothetical protein
MSTEAKVTPQSAWNKRNRERINKRERERYANDPEYRAHVRELKKKQYHSLSDEAKAARKERTNAKQRSKYYKDPEYREECKRRALERYYRIKAEKEKNDVQ